MVKTNRQIYPISQTRVYNKAAKGLVLDNLFRMQNKCYNHDMHILHVVLVTEDHGSCIVSNRDIGLNHFHPVPESGFQLASALTDCRTWRRPAATKKDSRPQLLRDARTESLWGLLPLNSHK